MAEVEKTMDALRSQIEFLEYTGNGFAYSAKIMRDALKLLREQQNKISELEELIDKLKE